MPKLENILGAIVSDITKAQTISDAYSRDLKLTYRENPSLKLLPIPRMEIKEVSLDLKFAILKAESEETSGGKVIIYQADSYQGGSQELSEGSYNFDSLVAGIGNDQLSSLKVPKGMKVTLYEHEFAGRSKTFTEDAPWVGDDFNDLTSSIKVEKNLVEDIASMEIEVVTQYLANLPESAISSITIRLDLTSA